MVRSIPRAVAGALLGALAGPVCFAAMYAVGPGITFDAARQAPFGSGFYPAERGDRSTFVWTSGRAEVAVPGLDRRAAWSCSIAFSGARPDAAMPQPELDVAIDGVPVAVRAATNRFQTLEVTAPARPEKPGLILTLRNAPTFVPGPSDDRVLGVQITELGCRPVAGAVVLPPGRAMGRGALAGAILGAAFGLTGITLGSVFIATGLAAAGQAYPLSTGAGPYLAYPTTVVWYAAWIGFLMVTGLKLLELGARQPLRHTARFVVVFSAGILYLKLITLCHPSKALVDALFHAHRLEWVLAGHFYFTQLSTSATPFPYAIGLYLFAAPWSPLTRDHVALLRIVASATDVIAGALLYVMVVRTWGDRRVGAMAVALFSLVPLPYAIVGNANLTNAFGQAVGLITVAVVVAGGFRPRYLAQLVGVILLATLGFVSHVSTLVLLFATLLAIGVFYRWQGGSELRAASRAVFLAAMIAAVLAVVFYWGHFGDLYKTQLARVGVIHTGPVAAVQAPNAERGEKAAASARAPMLGRTMIPLRGRLAAAIDQTLGSFGWPILLLACVGAWRASVGGLRDRLGLAIAAWGAACLALLLFAVLSPIDVRFQQDAWEFIGRVEHVACAAAVILAARGASWAWRAGTGLRLASGALLVAAVVNGVRAWGGWLP